MSITRRSLFSVLAGALLIGKSQSPKPVVIKLDGRALASAIAPDVSAIDYPKDKGWIGSGYYIREDE